MKYIVSLLTTANKNRNIIIEAESCEEAASQASKKYPSYTINRVSSNENEINYFTTMKKWKKNTN